MTVKFWRGMLLALPISLLLWALLAVGVARAAGEPYTASDVLAAIDQASEEIGVSAAYLTLIVRCEDPTLDPYAVGRQGELGPAQLHPQGLLPKFYALGYLDPFSPWQAVRFLAQEVSFGRARAWSCR